MAAELAQIYTPAKPKKRRGKPTPLRPQEVPLVPEESTPEPYQIDYAARASKMIADMQRYHEDEQVLAYRAQRRAEYQREAMELQRSHQRAQRLKHNTHPTSR